LPDGTLLISDIETHRILQFRPSGQLSFWGGTGQASFSGDGQHVVQATFNAPNDLKLDVANNAVLIADSNNHRIRKVDLRTLTITTIAGNGSPELSGDHGAAIQCSLNNPQGIAVDHMGNVLVADTYNHVIRRVGIDGIITTVAGSIAGLSGDSGPATSAQLSLPMAVVFDNYGGYFISDFGNSRIRRVSHDGKIETVCGVGKGSDAAGAGYSGDGELATKAKIFSPLDVAVVGPNFFYFSDSGNHRIRCVVHGVVLSVAGSGHPSGSGLPSVSGQPLNTNNDGIQLTPTLSVPAKMAIAPDGGLYFCDRGNRTIRLLRNDGTIEELTKLHSEKEDSN
jgi:sugar lactone lactonase YvrE